MPQARRTHTKSRRGCFECKRRKLKCDEAKPICSGCAKRDISCQYPDSGSSLLGAKAPGRTPRADNADLPTPASDPTGVNLQSDPTHAFRPNDERGFSPPSFGIDENPTSLLLPKDTAKFTMEDMGLWHHFITTTAKTLSSPWVNELQLLALSCDYLMHGILATAALHLAYLNPHQRQQFDYASAEHQHLALGPFRKSVSSITPENCNQVFAFSTLLMVFGFASYCSPKSLFPFAESTSYRGISHWMFCLRGCDSILRQAKSHIKSGPLGFIIPDEDFTESATLGGTRDPYEEDDKSLETMSHQFLILPLIKSTTTVEEMETYTDAIILLRKLLAAAPQIPDSVQQRSLIYIWLSKVSDTFVRLLSEERPPALIIIAYYCLLLNKCESVWYMQNRAYDLFEAVQECLHEEWTVYIEYPLRVLKGRS